jgi:hypothetical protein
MHKSPNKLLTNLILLRIYCVGWVLSIGIICHEFWHYKIAQLFQVQIETFKPFIFQKGNIFNIERYSPVRGEVSYTTQSVLNMSSLAAFCISIAPMISAIIILVIYKYNFLFVREYSVYYFILLTPILVSSFPSTGDFQFYNFHLRKNNTNHFLAKISWVLFLICAQLSKLFNKISEHLMIFLTLLLIVTTITPVTINAVNVCYIFSAYLNIQWFLNFILQKLEIKSSFISLPINEFYAQTFPHCKLLLLVQRIFLSFTRGNDIVPQTLGLDLKLNQDSIETFLSKFPQAKEEKSEFQSCRMFSLDLELYLLPSKSGYFIFCKNNGNLEQISIHFDEDYNLSTLNNYMEKIFKYIKATFFIPARTNFS